MKIKNLSPNSVIRFGDGVEAVVSLLNGYQKDVKKDVKMLSSEVVSIGDNGEIILHRKTVLIVNPEEEVEVVGKVDCNSCYAELRNAKVALIEIAEAMRPALSAEENRHLTHSTNYYPYFQYLYWKCNDKRPLVVAAYQARERVVSAEKRIRDSWVNQVTHFLTSSVQS